MNFLEAIRGWIGTPFHWHQRTKGDRGGCDCVGLIHGAMIECGLLPADFIYLDYGNHNPDITQALESNGTGLIERIGQPENGCVVSFLVRGDVQHLGVIDGDRLIHAHQLRGVIEDDWERWESRAHRYYRVIE